MLGVKALIVLATSARKGARDGTVGKVVREAVVDPKAFPVVAVVDEGTVLALDGPPCGLLEGNSCCDSVGLLAVGLWASTARRSIVWRRRAVTVEPTARNEAVEATRVVYEPMKKGSIHERHMHRMIEPHDSINH